MNDDKVRRYVLIVSLAGFLCGFDSLLISGANLDIKQAWQLSDWFHGTFIISIALWGTVIGALAGGYPTDKLGRKKTLIWVGMAFILSGIGTSLAPSPYIFSFFRFFGGIAAGIGSIAAPTYIAEISQAKHRGKLGMLFQLNLVTGILIAFLSNYALKGVGGEANDWRWMVGVVIVPALLFTVLLRNITESPRWLLLKSQRLAKVNPVFPRPQKPKDYARLFSGKYSRILLISFLMVFFNQFSGISFILFYAPEILEKAGFGTNESLLGSVSIGVVNLVFTIVGIYLIDTIGRKKLMYIGSIGYIISLTMIAAAFYFGLPAGFALIFILAFIVSHSVGQGAIIWVYIAEIFPTPVRAFGQAWSAGLLNGFAALITLFGAVLINKFSPPALFVSFAVLMVLQLLFTVFMMPETRGVTLESLESKLVKE